MFPNCPLSRRADIGRDCRMFANLLLLSTAHRDDAASHRSEYTLAWMIS
jgi:hypothetical protein